MNTASHNPDEDPVLVSLLREAAEDADTLGLILGGSRGEGLGDEESDYDLQWVLTDHAYRRRQERGEPLKRIHDSRPDLDIGYTCPAELVASTPHWAIPGLASARILLDKTGEVTRAVGAVVAIPEEKARDDAEAWFDGYLNGFYRSLKAACRGNELGTRLEAAESLMYLVRTLFALEGRWPPYHDRLPFRLHELEGQGWAPGELQELILAILRTGSAKLQQQLEGRVETLMRARGFGHVVDAWGGEIERVKRFRFE